jgi:hypothetical protein
MGHTQTHRHNGDFISLLTNIEGGGYEDRQQGDLISLKIRGDTQTNGQAQTNT